MVVILQKYYNLLSKLDVATVTMGLGYYQKPDGSNGYAASFSCNLGFLMLVGLLALVAYVV
ncbi:hypothetical protein [Neomoorella thermoacetica]|uniref:hypothetical protein n=1 Tax=Neomoorella thermoacetica TaxID=1525 RepID=UPI00084C2E13|nr:hypothetical protein [Moorella thermoacetica]